MMALSVFLRSLYRDRSGATAIEYGLIVALIALALVGTLGAFSTEVQAFFTNLAAKFNATV